MTDLTRGITRRTEQRSKGRRIIVTITRENLEFRLERCRYRYMLPIKSAWVYAAMLTAATKRGVR
jgi:hypothetical protein